MNALLEWTAVNITVTIVMGRTHVHADKVLGYTVMDSNVMVSYYRTLIPFITLCQHQILMSVLLELTIVLDFASILLGAIPVAVQMVIDCKVME